MPFPYPMLPFPMGSTWSQDVFEPEETDGESVVGTKWRVTNPDHPSEEMILLAVRYTGETDLTASNELMGFATLGSEIDGKAAAEGEPSKPLDPILAASGATVKTNDIVYVVDSGKVAVAKATTGALTANDLVTTSAAGAAVAATSGDFLLGVVVEDAAEAATTVVVDVYAGFP